MPGGSGRISDLTGDGRVTRAHFGRGELDGHPRQGENGRVATNVPLITDNSRKARGARGTENGIAHGAPRRVGSWERACGTERVRKGAEREREGGPGSRRARRDALQEGGDGFRWAPSRGTLQLF